MTEAKRVDKMDEKMSWSRRLLAIGFITIMGGVVLGAATDGSVWAKYVAIAGLVPIAGSMVVFAVETVMSKMGSRQTAS